MLDTDEIIGLRHTLRHAATHLDEVLEAITEDYHNGNKAPADVTSQLLPYLNSIENYVTTLRHALTVMATGGLADNGEGNWWIGDGDGPYDTLAAALANREDDEGFVTQGLVNVEDDITAPGGVFVMGADGDPEIETQIRSIVEGQALPPSDVPRSKLQDLIGAINREGGWRDTDTVGELLTQFLDAEGFTLAASPEERVLDGMRSAHSDGLEWLGLTNVAEYAGMQNSQAETVLAGLVPEHVERKGDRGAIYRLAP
jgi:hypothetical protein